MNVVIMQGLPGSGKSTYAQNYGGLVVSADDYFVELGGGTYKFDPSRLSEAHGQCFRRFVEAVTSKTPHVVVDNTNTTPMEISPYYLGAQAYGYDVEIVRVECPSYIAAARNTHGVSEATIHAMEKRMNESPLPPWWRLRVVKGV